MAKSLNLCMFIGNLTRDPEMRYLPDGTAVAKLSIAVQDDYKDKQGNKVERAEFIPLTAFGRLAEICGEYLKKGTKIHASGMFTTRKYQDNDGRDRYITEVKMDNMQMLSGPRDEQTGGAPPQRQAAARQAAPPQRPASRPAPNFSEMDADIPF